MPAIKLNKRRWMQKESALFVQLLFVACFLMWGGIGLFDTVDAPEVAGLLKYQDVLAFLSGVWLVGLTVKRRTFSRSFIIATLCLILLIVWGGVSGFIQGNLIKDIALELRPFLYMLLGIFLANHLDRQTVANNLIFYSFLVALIILIQFVVFLRNGPVFVNGVVPGNANSVNLPVIRPQSFHLITVGLIFAFSRMGLKKIRPITSIMTVIILAALLIMQSKTYWGLAFFSLIGLFLFDRTFSARKKIYLFLFFVVGAAFLTIITAPLLANDGRGGLFIVKKITDIFTDTQVSYGVVGVRVDESELMIKSWIESLSTTFFGQGLGHRYRETDLFFYRENLRDQERLSLFGHNYFLWFLLKFGLLGLLLFISVIVYGFANAAKKSFTLRRHFALATAVLLAAAVFLGTLESPLGGFLFGLLLFATAKPERQVDSQVEV